MPQPTPEFLAQLANAQDAYREAESRWMPEPGDYDVLLEDIHTGTYQSKKTGEQVSYLKPIWKILNGSQSDKSFQGSFRNTEFSSFLKEFLASLSLPDPEGTSLADSFMYVYNLVGKARCTLRITESESKDGRIFKNDKVVALVEVYT